MIYVAYCQDHDHDYDGYGYESVAIIGAFTTKEKAEASFTTPKRYVTQPSITHMCMDKNHTVAPLPEDTTYPFGK